jgi:hypothetical protein
MYLYFNKMVRNDWHCPECRKYYISIHKSIDDACIMASKEIRCDDEDEDKSKYINKLKRGKSVWIDEWVRRSNGDLYQILKITPNQKYDLHDPDDFDDVDLQRIDDKKNDSKIQCLLLHINIDKSEWCPDNINYYISFHNTIDDACDERLHCLSTSEDKMKSIWINKTIASAASAASAASVGGKDDMFNSSKDKDSAGDYYQIIKLEYDKLICLNDYCAYVQPEVW